MKMKTRNIYIFIVFLIGLSCTNQSEKQEETSADTTGSMLENGKYGSELLSGLANYSKNIEAEFGQIPDERKEQLKKISLYIKTKRASVEHTNLIFICTHNSRRSHMSQLWAQTAAHLYGIENVHCFSGGTEATAFNPRSVRALRKAGFRIEQTDSTSNPVYLVHYAEGIAPVKGFSKKYDDDFNPGENFLAIMTCSHADETCPIVYGATMRIAIPYEDPKESDNTPGEETAYDERCRQIATEMFYIFSQVNS